MFTVVKRVVKNQLLKKLVPSGFYYKSRGFCPCCEREVYFHSVVPDLRERFKCQNCNSSSRERAVMLAINKYFPDWRNRTVHESSPEMRGVSLKLSKECANYIPSQYFPNRPFGEVFDGYRNEDLEAQTFASGSFDIVITQDVMEHVFHPEKAFAEVERTLKEKGAHIFTVPIMNQHSPSEIRSVLGEDGLPVFLKPPEYHGNPVSGEGSLVTMYWGYDIIGFIKKNTGMNTRVENINSYEHGIGMDIDVFVSFKD